MTAYFIRRLMLVIPTFLGITLLVFAVTRIVPGGPLERMMSEAMMANSSGSGGTLGADMALSEDQAAEIKAYYGFDKPIWQSYIIWLGKVVSLDLGHSTRYGEPVWDIVKSRFPISIYFGLLTMFFTYTVCIPLGAYKAVKHSSAIDNITSVVIFLGYAIPGFVFGIFMMVIFSVNLEWFPLGGFRSENFDDLNLWGQIIDQASHTVLPLCAYLVGSFAVMTLMMKNSLMENLAADYIRTAIAKGLPFKKAVLLHAMRNSLIPIATSFGSNLTLIVTGSFLIETIFNIDGFGLLGYTSIVERDYPIVMGILVISSLSYLIGNIISDVCVAIVDPRIKFN